MSRILTRPMFRKGGSTNGIMTGLERPGYKNGTDPNFDIKFKERQAVYDKYAPKTSSPMGPGTLPGFLTSFGLDLLSRPAAGSIFQTAAQSAQQPFQQFQAGRAAEAAEERSLNRAILGDLMEAESDEEVARIKAAAGNEQTYAKKQAADSYAALYEPTIEKLEEDKKKADNPNEIEEIDAKINNIKVKILNVQASIYSGERTAEENQIEIISEYLKEGYSPEDIQALLPNVDVNAVIQTIFPKKAKAKGGRIGYEIGGEVETPMMNQTSAPVIAMDYTTLRARLPRQVGDDIVKLLAESEEALTDFANIRTQKDVDQFNQAYRVNLVLPQEV
jgi:hypothetical protein